MNLSVEELEKQLLLRLDKETPEAKKKSLYGRFINLLDLGEAILDEGKNKFEFYWDDLTVLECGFEEVRLAELENDPVFKENEAHFRALYALGTKFGKLIK